MGRLSTYIRVTPFEFLRKIDPIQIFNFLQHEHPQTIALVMAYLPADGAAQVMGMFPQEVQTEVAMRIAAMDRTAPEVLREVETVMERKLSSLINQDLEAAGGVKSLVDILNYSDRATERNILEYLDEKDAELADEVRKLMFVFEDLLILDAKAIQQLLKEVEMKDVGARAEGRERGRQEPDLREHVDAARAQMLQEDMEFMGPVKRRSVEEAQGRIVAIVRRLEETGQDRDRPRRRGRRGRAGLRSPVGRAAASSPGPPRRARGASPPSRSSRSGEPERRAAARSPPRHRPRRA